MEWSKAPALDFAGEFVKIDPLVWQQLGLIETATGYGGRLRTQYMVRYRNRWRRVYCACYSNVGTNYIIDSGLRRIIHLQEP